MSDQSVATPPEVGEFPVPNIKDVIIATVNPHFASIRDFLKDEALWSRKNIEEQNRCIAMIQASMDNFFNSLLTQIEKAHDSAIKIGKLDGEKADKIQLQTQTIDYRARIDLYEGQLRDMTSALTMSIGLMSDFKLELEKVREMITLIDHSYVLDQAPPEVQDQYNQILSSLQIMANRAGDYVRDLPGTLK